MSGVSGVPELLSRLQKAAAVGEEAARTARDELGEAVRDEAQATVLVDTGNLRDSITYEDGRVFTDVDYADDVEYGPNGEPYMRPAADMVEAEPPTERAEEVLRQI